MPNHKCMYINLMRINKAHILRRGMSENSHSFNLQCEMKNDNKTLLTISKILQKRNTIGETIKTRPRTVLLHLFHCNELQYVT